MGTDNDLEQYFSQFGTVTSIDQKVWPDTGKKRGYGYIEFDDEDAVDMIVLLGIHIIGGARLEARKGLSKEQQEAIRNGPVRGKLAQRAAENAGYGYGGGRTDGISDTWGGGYGNMQNMMSSMQGGGMQNMQQMQQMMQQMQSMQSSGQGGESVGQMQAMMMQMMKMQMQMMMGSTGGGGGGNQRDPNYVAPPLPSEPYPKASYGSRGSSYTSRY